MIRPLMKNYICTKYLLQVRIVALALSLIIYIATLIWQFASSISPKIAIYITAIIYYFEILANNYLFFKVWSTDLVTRKILYVKFENYFLIKSI